jgi:hypothetical protein
LHGFAGETPFPPSVHLAKALLNGAHERDALRAEVKALRGAVIHVCDLYTSHRAEQVTVREIRRAANHLSTPFNLDAIDASLAAKAKLVESTR